MSNDQGPPPNHLDPAQLEKQYRMLSKEQLSASEKRRRGYFLQDLIYSLLFAEKLEPRTSYRPKGEEVDGSFVWQDRVFLIEAKWHGQPLPASDLYTFKGKVDGKLSGTLGVFFSISGYSKDAIEAFEKGKDLNIICFDRADIEAFVIERVSFLEILRWKHRQACEVGSVYVPWELKKKIATTPVKPLAERTKQPTESLSPPRRILLIICETQTEAQSLQVLLRTADGGSELLEALNVQIMSAKGIESLGRRVPEFINIASAQYADRLAGVVVFLDENAVDRRTELEYRISTLALGIPVQILEVTPALRVVLEYFTTPNAPTSPIPSHLRKETELVLSEISEFTVGLEEEGDDTAPWESAGFEAAEAALAAAEWNFHDPSVELFDEYGRGTTYRSLDDLSTALAEIASEAAYAYMPYDSGEPVFFFDEDSAAEAALETYRDELKKLGWD